MKNYILENKTILIAACKSFFVGMLVGFAIKYFRSIELAPFIAGFSGMIYGIYDFKNSLKKQ
jgi:hypothetical protein